MGMCRRKQGVSSGPLDKTSPNISHALHLILRFVGTCSISYEARFVLLTYSSTAQGTSITGICGHPDFSFLISVCWQCQGSLLLLVGLLLGMPFVATSMIAAHTYVSSR